MIGLFGVADSEEARGETITARELFDEGARRIDIELADQPAVQARMLSTVGKVYGSLGLYDDARPLLEKAVTTAERSKNGLANWDLIPIIQMR